VSVLPLHRIPYSPRGVRSSRGSRTLVLSRRRMNWKFDFSPETSDIFAVWWRCRGLSEGRWWYPLGLDVAKFERRRSHFAAPWRLCAGSHDRVRIFPSPQSQPFDELRINVKPFTKLFITLLYWSGIYISVLGMVYPDLVLVCILCLFLIIISCTFCYR
jgi:hypothetical protein